MVFRREDDVADSETRGQSTLIGVVLLIGMVATLSLTFFFVAGDAVASLEHQAEDERVEGAFVELSQQLQTASSSNDISRTIDLDVDRMGQSFARRLVTLP